MSDSDRTASLMTPTKLAQVARAAAPASPTDWLDRMAADAGHLHLARLAELRGVLHTHARARDTSALAQALTLLAGRLGTLEFQPLREQAGWWARTTGKSRHAGSEFAGQFAALDAPARDVPAQVQALTKGTAGEAAATERTLVEFEVEWQALDKIVDQGGRWLQDMRSQLKGRLAAAADAATQQQVKHDAARCEILVQRLKSLRAISALARGVQEQAQEAAAGRAALHKALQQPLLAELKGWHQCLAALAQAAAAGKGVPDGIDEAQAAHGALQRRLADTLAQLAAVQAQEDTLAATLAELGRRLDAAR